MKAEQDAHWDINKHIVTYFTKVEQVCKHLKKLIPVDDKELLSNPLYTIKEGGELKNRKRKQKQINMERRQDLF